MQASSAS